MAQFVHQHGRLTIFFTNHALDRWWERCEANDLHGRQAAMNLLRERLGVAAQEARRSFTTVAPPWCRLSLYHRARAEGYLSISDEACFVVNRNPGGDLIAATYIEKSDRTQEEAA